MPSSSQVPCGLETVINSWNKKVFHNPLLAPASLPAPFPWSLETKCVSSSLSNANSAFGLVLGFFSYHGWNIYLLPAGGFKQAAIAGLSREHVRNRSGKSCSSTQIFFSTLQTLLSALYICTCLQHLCLCSHSGWKESLDLLVWQQQLKCRCDSLKSVEVALWNLVTLSPHTIKLLYVWR